jgi:hypothetical protein
MHPGRQWNSGTCGQLDSGACKAGREQRGTASCSRPAASGQAGLYRAERLGKVNFALMDICPHNMHHRIRTKIYGHMPSQYAPHCESICPYGKETLRYDCQMNKESMHTECQASIPLSTRQTSNHTVPTRRTTFLFGFIL